jgi:hypothetical protein
MGEVSVKAGKGAKVANRSDRQTKLTDRSLVYAFRTHPPHAMCGFRHTAHAHKVGIGVAGQWEDTQGQSKVVWRQRSEMGPRANLGGHAAKRAQHGPACVDDLDLAVLGKGLRV